MKSYDFEAKHDYHRRLLITEDGFSSKPRATRVVAYLDTSEAGETEFRLSNGYRAENLWAINDNPAHVAALTLRLRRNGSPDVNTVGVDFESAVLDKMPPPDIVNFDGMGNLSARLTKMLGRIIKKTPKRAIVAATLLAGRENSKQNAMAAIAFADARIMSSRRGDGVVASPFGTPLSRNDMSRLGLAVLFSTIDDGQCVAHVVDIKWDGYVSSSNQKMLWFAAQIEHHSDAWAERARASLRSGATPRLCSMRAVKFGAVPYCLTDTSGLSAIQTNCAIKSHCSERNGDRNGLATFLMNQRSSSSKRLGHTGYWD